MTDIRGEELMGGILKEFGDALSAQLNLQPRYMILPRTRVEGALLRGHADLLCDLRPEWLDNRTFLWSDAIISNRMIVGMRSETPLPPSLNAIAGLRVGTIQGYRYPEVEYLQPKIVRDNAANDTGAPQFEDHGFRYLLCDSCTRKAGYHGTESCHRQAQGPRHDPVNPGTLPAARPRSLKQSLPMLRCPACHLAGRGACGQDQNLYCRLAKNERPRGSA